ncbi:urease accessory protein UreF [Anabaena sp. FACHB-1237]|uniref:urease accessory protein UreF n=1 Tax=Anabaena sp. FACHB-1237 TaxID=2692769 RepID=UPI001680D40A|nr:urease accessory protein UreF [Anabaena sp. FACHB-1237]MBD2139146.1 urease accessory protein UreF [Anabaena sp. FACHB-1237]
MEITLTPNNFLSILQLASPALPVGAYCYSEGLEMLVENGIITDSTTLKDWLVAELSYGAIRVDVAMIKRGFECVKIKDLQGLKKWNLWLSAFRDTEEIRAASWQMGRSLMTLLIKLEPQFLAIINVVGYPINYAIAYSIACSYWQINLHGTLLAYLHSWLSNLITAGIKIIPIGQTAGQILLLELQPILTQTISEILTMTDDDLECCSWGLSLASMQHETQYTRLFRS